ncbi:MAG TPA: hypothetical protein VEW45_00300, partial [Candidatus Dormibacteraeota bacterium]|nr:hypothetical protein [Candidatus Dormibacteraeota bacterium]
MVLGALSLSVWWFGLAAGIAWVLDTITGFNAWPTSWPPEGDWWVYLALVAWVELVRKRVIGLRLPIVDDLYGGLGGDNSAAAVSRTDEVTRSRRVKRLKIFGNLRTQEYAEAYCRRLVERVPERAAPTASWDVDLQAARRAAIGLLRHKDTGEHADLDPSSLTHLMWNWPDIDEYVRSMETGWA